MAEKKQKKITDKVTITLSTTAEKGILVQADGLAEEGQEATPTQEMAKAIVDALQGMVDNFHKTGKLFEDKCLGDEDFTCGNDECACGDDCSCSGECKL